MPHVELLGAAPLSAFHSRFHPDVLEEKGTIIKAPASYLSHDGRSLLIECLCVEGYLRQSFFVLISQTDASTMIRLLPRTSPEKTDGVRRCLAWIASLLKADSPGSRVGKTNLPEPLL